MGAISKSNPQGQVSGLREDWRCQTRRGSQSGRSLVTQGARPLGGLASLQGLWIENWPTLHFDDLALYPRFQQTDHTPQKASSRG